MTWHDDIRETVRGLFLLSGTSVYVGIGSMVAVLTWVGDHGGVVLGMEGLSCDGRVVRPLEDCLADFSSITGTPAERVRLSIEAAERILASWDRAQFVDLTLAWP